MSKLADHPFYLCLCPLLQRGGHQETAAKLLTDISSKVILLSVIILKSAARQCVRDSDNDFGNGHLGI